MRMILSLLLALCFPTLDLLAQQPEQPIKTTLCDIKKDPMAFNKKLVEVSGYASHGFEDSMFEDPSCFWGKGLPGIWMEYGGTAATDTMYCCGITPSKEKKQLVVQGLTVTLIRDPVFENFDALLHSKPDKEISIRATVRGRVFAVQESVSRRTSFAGYGHMGCCMLLAIEQVVSVDSKKPEPSIFDLAHSYESKKP
jgi:hypothetical protein